MRSKYLVRGGLISAAVLGGTLGATAIGAGPASAAPVRPTYQLTPREHRHACGNFIGTIIFSDGTSLDCYSGIATL